MKRAAFGMEVSLVRLEDPLASEAKWVPVGSSVVTGDRGLIARGGVAVAREEDADQVGWVYWSDTAGGEPGFELGGFLACYLSTGARAYLWDDFRLLLQDKVGGLEVPEMGCIGRDGPGWTVRAAVEELVVQGLGVWCGDLGQRGWLNKEVCAIRRRAGLSMRATGVAGELWIPQGGSWRKVRLLDVPDDEQVHGWWDQDEGTLSVSSRLGPMQWRRVFWHEFFHAVVAGLLGDAEGGLSFVRGNGDAMSQRDRWSLRSGNAITDAGGQVGFNAEDINDWIYGCAQAAGYFLMKRENGWLVKRLLSTRS